METFPRTNQQQFTTGKQQLNLRAIIIPSAVPQKPNSTLAFSKS